jgi:hypothetical protein
MPRFTNITGPSRGLRNTHEKDAVENFLNREVCRGTMQLAERSARSRLTGSPSIAPAGCSGRRSSDLPLL